MSYLQVWTIRNPMSSSFPLVLQSCHRFPRSTERDTHLIFGSAEAASFVQKDHLPFFFPSTSILVPKSPKKLSQPNKISCPSGGSGTGHCIFSGHLEPFPWGTNLGLQQIHGGPLRACARASPLQQIAGKSSGDDFDLQSGLTSEMFISDVTVMCIILIWLDIYIYIYRS